MSNFIFHSLSVCLSSSTSLAVCAYLNLALLLLARLASIEHSHFHVIIGPSSLFLAVLITSWSGATGPLHVARPPPPTCYLYGAKNSSAAPSYHSAYLVTGPFVSLLLTFQGFVLILVKWFLVNCFLNSIFLFWVWTVTWQLWNFLLAHLCRSQELNLGLYAAHTFTCLHYLTSPGISLLLFWGCLSVSKWMPCVFGGSQKRESNLLELEFKVGVSHRTWMLGTEFGYSGRVANRTILYSL